MIELLPDMPEGVTGVRVSGRLRGDELRQPHRHTPSARIGAPRNRASRKPSASTASLPGESSTTTAIQPVSGSVWPPLRTIATGQCALRATLSAVEPRTVLPTRPIPTDPTQTIAAPYDSSIRPPSGDPYTMSHSTLTGSPVACSAASALRRDAWPYSSSMLLPCSGPVASRGITWTSRSGTLRLTASAIAHLAALIAASEPSMPTTIRSDDWFIASSRSPAGLPGHPDAIGPTAAFSRAV